MFAVYQLPNYFGIQTFQTRFKRQQQKKYKNAAVKCGSSAENRSKSKMVLWRINPRPDREPQNHNRCINIHVCLYVGDTLQQRTRWKLQSLWCKTSWKCWSVHPFHQQHRWKYLPYMRIALAEIQIMTNISKNTAATHDFINSTLPC